MASNKINVGPALTAPLALAYRGTRSASAQFEKLAVAEKCTAIKQHPVAVKVVGRIQVSTEILWAVLGFVLLIHGAQFKNLFLCTQAITFFCYGRLKESVISIKNDITTAWEKMAADEPEQAKADAKAEAKPDNKHAQKRQSKSDGEKVTDPAELKRKQEEDAAAAKKVLKALDSDKVARTAFDVFASFMACHMVMQGGVMQVIVVVHALVKAAKKRIEALFEYGGLEDMLDWTGFFLSFVLYVAFGSIAVILAPLAQAMNLAVCGAHLVLDHGLPVAEAMGRIESAESFAGSVKGLALLGGLTAFGTFWQLWALMADSGMAWYFNILYLPAVSAEWFVSMF